MRQGLNHTQRVETGVGLRVDPRVVLSSQLLQLNQQELEQAIETELNENPALERLETDSEPINGEELLGSPELRRQLREAQERLKRESSGEPSGEPLGAGSGGR